MRQSADNEQSWMQFAADFREAARWFAWCHRAARAGVHTPSEPRECHEFVALNKDIDRCFSREPL